MPALARLPGFDSNESNGLGVVAAVALVVILLATIELFAGAVSVGVTTDEPIHSSRTQTLLDTGWYIPSYLLENGEPGPSELASPFVYGPGFSRPAHLMAGIFGIESPGLISEEAGAWQFRHLLLGVIALLTVVAVGITVGAVTGSRVAALWAGAALISTPVWLGMGMFNIKDLPVAAGYTFLTSGLVLSLVGPRRLAGWTFGAVVALCAAGILLSIGVRFAMWVPVLVSVFAWFLLLMGRSRIGTLPVGMSLKAVSIGSLIGVVAVVGLYPDAFSNPIEWLTESVTNSSAYPFSGSTLTFGTLVPSSPPPLWYLPAWTFAVVPLLTGTLALAGIAAWCWRLVHSYRRAALRSFLIGGDALMLLVLVQLLLLPVGAVILGSTIYDGIRQHLYVVPAIASFAGYGLFALWTWRRFTSKSGPWWRRVVAAVACLAIVVPFVEQSLLYPYNYSYVNPVAGIGGANGRWETDFWWASGREAAGRVPGGATVACSRNLEAPVFTECGKNQVAQYLDPETIPFDPTSPGQEEVWVLAWRRAGNQPPEFCRVEDGVQRWFRGEQVVMSWVMRCPADRVAASYQSIG